ncbi:MAG: hypothetical protein SGJ24_10735 [Chloroflexota bacterium]|nr:hypothetical protein [Chloroflexota bacterium]
MSQLAPLTKEEIEAMVADWYVGLDVHRAQVDMIKYVHSTDLQMRFPEATLYTQAEFELWFQGVIRIFFDEVHTMQSLDVQVSEDGSKADVKLVVRWEASRWKAPAAKSERLIFDAYQTWEIKRDPKSLAPAITIYIVDELRQLPGGVPL